MLQTIAVISLIIAGVCSLIIAADVVRHPQKIWIMNLVCILTPLYSSVLGLKKKIKSVVKQIKGE